ncbi:MAG TPA: GGDEF domain-containing protein [Solirubrobacteraceae bacterium]|nr:GGDEF domain-containing protein [Solirubrobacteraceae bacterium]
MQEKLGRRRDDPVAATPLPQDRVSASLLPFAAAAALAAIATPIATKVDWPLYAVAVVLGALAGMLRTLDWPRVDWLRVGSTREVLPSAIFLVAVALMRQSAGGANSGIGIVALMPVFWTALHGDRRQLCLVVVCVALFFFAPLVLVGPPEYPSSQYRAGVLFVAVATIVGFTTQWLVSEVRFQASQSEQREQALGAVARVMRGLVGSAAARQEVCEAARTIGEASFAFLYEPTGRDRSLRSTATAGIELTPLEVDPNAISAARDAFVSKKSLLWTESHPALAINRDLWKRVGQPASLLFEPVSRGEEEVVGVLVVGWSETIAADSMRAALITLLAHEIATAIERGDMVARITDLASTDALTGLPNRRAWDTRLREALLKRAPTTLAMLDLDHFKQYNDSHGHPAGDRLLRETAAAWREELRSGDFLARIGGEEFALLLPETSAGDAAAVVERLRERMPYGQTCSAGIVAHVPGESADSLMGRADEALYQAKAGGRDRVSVAA